jgi:glycosyl transferase family 87
VSFSINRWRDGSWLDPGLMRFAAWASIAITTAALAGTFATGTGTVDAWGRPLGTDFSQMWTAGRMALDGQAASAYDWGQHHAVQQLTHGRADILFYGFHYPPLFMLVAAPLAALPYVPALIVWQAATLFAAVWLVTRIVPSRDTIPVTLGCPVVFVCLTHGHNGFLTAFLFGGGLLWLERRPWLAGALLGLLAYKPQFGLIIPLVLIAGGHWRALAGAALAVLASGAMTLLLWGIEPWQAFLASLGPTQSVVLEQGGIGWHKIQSAFAAVRAWHGSIGFAYGAQAIVAFLVIAANIWLWRTSQPRELRNAGLMIGALLVTPYSLDYDTVVILVAMAFFVTFGLREGFLPWERTILAVAWMMPGAGRQIAEATLLPAGFLTMAMLFVLVVRRAGAFQPLGRGGVAHSGAPIGTSIENFRS